MTSKRHNSCNGPWPNKLPPSSLLYDHNIVQCQHCKWYSNFLQEASIYDELSRHGAAAINTGRFATSSNARRIYQDPKRRDWTRSAATS